MTWTCEICVSSNPVELLLKICLSPPLFFLMSLSYSLWQKSCVFFYSITCLRTHNSSLALPAYSIPHIILNKKTSSLLAIQILIRDTLNLSHQSPNRGSFSPSEWVHSSYQLCLILSLMSYIFLYKILLCQPCFSLFMRVFSLLWVISYLFAINSCITTV